MKLTNNAVALTPPTGVSQSSQLASVSTMFDGPNVELPIDRQTGSDFTLNSATHSVPDTLTPPLQPYRVLGRTFRDDHTLRDWTLFDSSRTVTSAAHGASSWNKSDCTDSLAAGHWMHVSGHFNNGIVNADIGALIDGPEFARAPATLPVLGTATYRGQASGLYPFYYGPGWQHFGGDAPAEGTRESGVYTGLANLMANFEPNTISGCIGCMLSGEDPQRVSRETAGDIIERVICG